MGQVFYEKSKMGSSGIQQNADKPAPQIQETAANSPF
jgi:hypothetical protein